MRKRDLNAWFRAGAQAWALGVEASAVMALRGLRVAEGGAAAERELRRMVAEKLDAALELQQRAMTGRLGATPATAATRTIHHYRKRVRANRRRLSSSK
jgi:hypothetical protein